MSIDSWLESILDTARDIARSLQRMAGDVSPPVPPPDPDPEPEPPEDVILFELAGPVDVNVPHHVIVVLPADVEEVEISVDLEVPVGVLGGVPGQDIARYTTVWVTDGSPDAWGAGACPANCTVITRPGKTEMAIRARDSGEWTSSNAKVNTGRPGEFSVLVNVEAGSTSALFKEASIPQGLARQSCPGVPAPFATGRLSINVGHGGTKPGQDKPWPAGTMLTGMTVLARTAKQGTGHRLPTREEFATIGREYLAAKPTARQKANTMAAERLHFQATNTSTAEEMAEAAEAFEVARGEALGVLAELTGPSGDPGPIDCTLTEWVKSTDPDNDTLPGAPYTIGPYTVGWWTLVHAIAVECQHALTWDMDDIARLFGPAVTDGVTFEGYVPRHASARMVEKNAGIIVFNRHSYDARLVLEYDLGVRMWSGDDSDRIMVAIGLQDYDEAVDQGRQADHYLHKYASEVEGANL